jgi:hypothetical protein
MARFRFDIDEDAIEQSNQHTLFVEGANEQEIDAIVLQELLKNNSLGFVKVQTMGACDNVRSAAQALIAHHPNYYFLIDRDNQDQKTVDDSWNKFPDPNAFNMLIWHKRELENYFIDPEYLAKSIYLKSNLNPPLEQRILEYCNSRLFMEAANLTLSYLKNKLREVSITKTIFKDFGNSALFNNEVNGWLQLEQRSNALDNTLAQIQSDFLDKHGIENIYKEFIKELSGGLPVLQYDCGSWLERMSGKEIFRHIANQCFEIDDANRILSSKEKNNQIAKQLVKLPINQQSDDFQKLVEILKNRIGFDFKN